MNFYLLYSIKMRKITTILSLATLMLCLTWCWESLWNWNESEINENVETYTTAQQVCLDNGGVLAQDDEWEENCFIGDRWILIKDMEEVEEEI